MSKPARMTAFNEYMSVQRIGQRGWLDSFRIENYLDVSESGEGVQFVDIGGGQGYQCVTLLQKFSEFKGKIVL